MLDGAVPSEKSCFIAMPVTTSRADAERYRGDDAHWLHVLESVFVPAVEQAGFRPIRPTTEGSDLIHSRIVRHLQDADMVLCDLSGHNPNVFFELGVRTATNLPIALVRDEHTELPFDTGGINTHSYRSALNAWEMPEEVASLARYLESSERACEGSNPLWRTFGLTLTATNPGPETSQEEARWELVSRELADIRGAINASKNSPAAASRRGDRHFRPLNKDADVPATLRAFAREALNMATDSGRPVRWFWTDSDVSAVFVPTDDYEDLHIATRRAIDEAAFQRGLQIVEMPT